MTTVLVQILDRVDAVLKAVVPAGCQVFRERAEAESRNEAPNINVQPRDDSVESFAGDMDRHQQMVDVRVQVRADPPTPAVEAIHALAHAALTTDSMLLALAVSVRLESSTFAESEADATALDKTSRYRFTYLIPKNTL